MSPFAEHRIRCKFPCRRRIYNLERNSVSLPWYVSVIGASTFDAGLLVRILEVSNGVWNYPLPWRDLTLRRFSPDSEISLRTRPLRTSQASVSTKKLPE